MHKQNIIERQSLETMISQESKMTACRPSVQAGRCCAWYAMQIMGLRQECWEICEQAVKLVQPTSVGWGSVLWAVLFIPKHLHFLPPKKCCQANRSPPPSSQKWKLLRIFLEWTELRTCDKSSEWAGRQCCAKIWSQDFPKVNPVTFILYCRLCTDD